MYIKLRDDCLFGEEGLSFFRTFPPFTTSHWWTTGPNYPFNCDIKNMNMPRTSGNWGLWVDKVKDGASCQSRVVETSDLLKDYIIIISKELVRQACIIDIVCIHVHYIY